MRPARLRNPDKTVVRLASRGAVLKYFAGRTSTERETCWLDATNRYRKTATQTYDGDLHTKTIDEPALVAYIASSAPTHAIDGWSYLARSTEAVLRGDLCAALHLGYYAELRAAMALLACEGVGIFNSRHPVISKSGATTTAISKIQAWNGKKYNDQRAGTHMTVWPLLSHWGSLERAARVLDQLLAPEGISLRGWLDALKIPRPVRAVSKQWLRRWGVDLSMLSEDHEARNMVSYRPSELRLPPTPTAARAHEFVAALWTLLEPSSGGRFDQLERALLRKVVRDSGPVPTSAKLQSALLFDPPVADRWAEFFAAPDPLPLSLAEQTSDVESADCALQVISRASLLLYLATGSTRRHLLDAGYGSGTLEFFWRRQCEIRFDGPKASLPSDPIDLWQDISDTLSDASQWLASSPADLSLGEWRSAQSTVTSKLVGLELAGVWGLVS